MCLSSVTELIQYVRNKFAETPISIDLGSAEGLIVLLMHYYRFKSYGIERVVERLNASLQLRDNLNLAGKVGFTSGDWTEDKPFKRMGLKIEDIDFFYIYPSKGGAEKAFKLVSERAKPGAILAVNLAVGNSRYSLPNGLSFDRTFLCPIGQIDVYTKVVFEPLWGCR